MTPEPGPWLVHHFILSTEWALKIDCPIKEKVSEFMSGIGLSQVSRVNKNQSAEGGDGVWASQVPGRVKSRRPAEAVLISGYCLGFGVNPGFEF